MDDMKKIAEQRMDICKQCDKYNQERNICMACMCNLRLKTNHEKATCPEGKW